MRCNSIPLQFAPPPLHAISGWGVRYVCSVAGFAFILQILAGALGCMCLCVRLACSPLILAGVCSVCVWLRLLTSPRQSWLGFSVFVSGFGFLFHPAIPGWGVGVCVFVCALGLYPVNPRWGVQC